MTEGQGNARGAAMRVSWRVTTRPMIGADVGDMRWVPHFKGGSAVNPNGHGRDSVVPGRRVSRCCRAAGVSAGSLLGCRPSGVAVPRKHAISGDRIEACQRFDRLGGVRGERRDLGAARPRGHRVGGECVADEQGAERCDVQGGAAGGVAGRQDDPRAARDVQVAPSPKVVTCCSLGVRSPPCRALNHKTRGGARALLGRSPSLGSAPRRGPRRRRLRAPTPGPPVCGAAARRSRCGRCARG